MTWTPVTPRRRRLRYASRKAMLLLAAMSLAGGLVVADRAGLFGKAPTPDRQKYHLKTFRVVYVVDGDTLDLDVSDGPHEHTRVRLWGVDTPETKKPNTPVQHFGPEASEFTRSHTLNKDRSIEVKVELEPSRPTRDKYGRLLAFIYLPDGRMLNRLLIEEGYGYADPRFEHHLKGEFARLQTQARKARRGLWKDLTNDDLPEYYKDRLKLP